MKILIKRRIAFLLAFIMVFSAFMPLATYRPIISASASASPLLASEPLIFYDFNDGMPDAMIAGFQGENKKPEIVWDNQRGKVLKLNPGFNENESFVSFPNPYADIEGELTAATMMLWVKADLLTTALEWENLISFVDEEKRLTLQGKPYLCWNGGADNWVDIKANDNLLIPGKWQHLAVTISQNDVAMYLDGEKIDIEASGADGTANTLELWDVESMLNVLKNAGESYLGKGSFWGTMDAYLDSVAFYDLALTSTQVKEAYEADPCVIPADITSDLKAYYSFDDDFTDKISGESAVEVGGAGAGIFNVVAAEKDIELTVGKSGRAAKFAGPGGNGLRLPSSINSKDYTISFWMNPQEYTDFSSLIFARRDVGHFLSIMGQGWNDNSSHPQFRMWRDAASDQTELNYVNGNTLDLAMKGKWTHVTYVVEQDENDLSARLSLYINGKRQQVFEAGELKNEGPVIPNFFSEANTEFYLGINWWDSTYNGSIDELYLFERALTNDDVMALHAKGLIKDDEQTAATPVKRVSVHDPSIVKDNDTYYIFGSHMAWSKSDDLINWTNINININNEYEDLFGEIWNDYCKTSSNPDLIGNMWAPDVIYNEAMGKWCMYMSINGDDWNSAIVLLTADNIEGPYNYVGPVVYSGFNTSSHPAEKTDVYQVLGDNANLTRYQSTGDTKLNAIDPNVRYDQEGNLWMSFGSWFGGIYLLKLDNATGLRDYTTTYQTVKDQSDQYYGYKIAGGYGVSGEGPYIIYDDESKYYYLYVSYAGLAANAGYNMRLYRSKDIMGPYLDANDTSAVRNSGGDNKNYGIKVMGNYVFDTLIKGYKAPGHNSALIDDDGKMYLIYHTRFDDGTESHEVRVHQMFMNEDNWPVVAPYEYYGDDLSISGYTKEEVIGNYEFINHGLASDGVMLKNLYITLEEDGNISGQVNGTWQMDETSANVTINIDNVTYKGVFFQQSDESVYRSKTMTFTAIGHNNQTIWASKQNYSDIEAVAKVASSLENAYPSKTIYDLDLPAKGNYNTEINWTISEPDVISNTGKVTRQLEDVLVTLTARITKGEEVYIQNLQIIIKGTGTDNPNGISPKYEYKFEDSLSGAKVVSRELANEMPKIDENIEAKFADGKHGRALHLDGTYGVLLDAQAVGETYSISYWVKPSKLITFGPILQISSNPLSDTDARWLNMTQTEWGKISSPTVWSRNAKTGAWPWYQEANSSAKGYRLPLNEWTHVTLTVDGSFTTVDKASGDIIPDTYYSQLYINGEKIGEGPVATGTFIEDAKVYLGINCWDPNFEGYFDDLKIYDSVLTENEVKASMDLSAHETEKPVFTTNIENINGLANDAKIEVSITTDTPDANIIYYIEDSADGKVYTKPIEFSTTNKNGRSIVIEAVAKSAGMNDSERARLVINFLAQEGRDPLDPVYEYSFDGKLNAKALKQELTNTMPQEDGSINVQYEDGVVGNALKLDGSYGLVLDAEDVGETYSIAYWLKPTNLYTFGPIMQIGRDILNESSANWLSMTQTEWDGISAPVIWSKNAKTGAWPWYLKSFESAKSFNIPLNEWTHIVVTVDSSKQGKDLVSGKNIADTYHSDLYINGEKIGEGPVATGTFIGESKVYLGINPWDNSFEGLYDEIKIYDFVLSQEKIDDIVNIQTPDPEPTPTKTPEPTPTKTPEPTPTKAPEPTPTNTPEQDEYDIRIYNEEFEKSTNDINGEFRDSNGKLLYRITFAKKDLASFKDEFKTLAIKTSISNAKDNKEMQRLAKIDRRISNGNLIDIKTNTKLQVKSKIKYYVGDQVRFANSNNAYIYLYNPKTKTLNELPTTKLKVDKMGYITMNIVESGTYLITTKQLIKKAFTPILDQVTVNVTKSTINKGKRTTIKVELPATIEKVVSVTHKTSNKKIARVSKKGSVLGVKTGKVTITTTLTTSDGRKKIIKTNIKIK